MNKSCTYVFPALAILLALACFGVPARAVAQDPVYSPYCYQCKLWKKIKNVAYLQCDPDNNLVGHLACELSNGGKRCTTSALPGGFDDCITLPPTLAGRVSPDVESEPWHQAVGGMELQQVVSAVDVHLEVARHGCTGAIIQRRYSSARIAALRLSLWRVTI